MNATTHPAATSFNLLMVVVAIASLLLTIPPGKREK